MATIESPYVERAKRLREGMMRLGFAPFTRGKLRKEAERLEGLDAAWREGYETKQQGGE